MELLLAVAIISYIIYLRYYADFDTKAEKERLPLPPGIEAANLTDKSSPLASNTFFDQRLLINSAFVLVHSAMLLAAIKLSPVIHWPYLMAAVSAAAIGFAEPRKGWFLAFLQSTAILISYYLLTQTPARSGERELEAFNLYGSIGLTFVGSFVGSILKRAMGR